MPPPSTRARALMTPSVETKGWEGEVGETLARVAAKAAMLEIVGLPYGEPPRSRRSTVAREDRVAAREQPAVPPPTMM